MQSPYLSPEEHQKAIARYLKSMDRTIREFLDRKEAERAAAASVLD